MLKPRSIQSKLFFSYSTLIVSIIAMFVISFYILTGIQLEKSTSESLHQLSSNISAQLDTELENMNSLSLKVLFSDPIKDLFFSNLYDESNINIQGQREFNSIMYSITGPQFPVYQINMFQLNGNFVGIGNKSMFAKISKAVLESNPWINESIRLDGNRLITIPHKDSWIPSDKTVVSLFRAFSHNWGEPVNSILEIQYDFNKLKDIVDASYLSAGINSDSSKKVLIFDSSGKTIFPFTQDPQINSEEKFYWDSIKINDMDTPTFTVKNPLTRDVEIVAYTLSDFSNWTVLVAEPEKLLMMSVAKFRNTVLLAGIGIILITLLISYSVSKGLTDPIKKIHKSIKNLSLQALPTKAPLQHDSGINELEELNLSFQEMCKNLTSSLEAVVASRSHEIQAHMLALQSQMNPHFLYNTLSVIGIMAENGNTQNIVKMCEDLSDMLRYISTDNSMPVTMKQELEYTQSFVNLMKHRYGEFLNIEINLPESLLAIPVPRLIIEPLVENCTKYGVNVVPPWNIVVEGKQLENRWTVTVKDNGQGFDEENLKAIHDKLSSINPNTDLPKLKLDGMGLLNIYIRLKLLYGDQTQFEVGNAPDGGAFVTIGGPVIM